MVYIPFQTEGFMSGIPTSGNMFASMPMLQWAAVTVGISATAASIGRRPLAELTWRCALMDASLEANAGQWHRTKSYGRLDGSEKSAVSYFLGMAQAQLSCALILGIPTLVHLDVHLRAMGRTTRKSRPDFLGYHPWTGAAVAVEAKGRTHGYTEELVDRAKDQAAKLPSLTGASSSSDIASIAWFETDRVWHSMLVDPPRKREPNRETAHSVVATHYLPIVEAVTATEYGDEGDWTLARVDAIDLTLSVPTAIVDILGRAQPSDAWEPEALNEAGRSIVDILRSSADKPDVAPNPDEARGTSTQYIGLDLVGVQLGPSWLERLQR